MKSRKLYSTPPLPQPHRVCHAGSFPTDYTVNMVVSVTYQGLSRSHACVESIVDAVSSDLQARMNQSCSTALARGDVVLSPVAGRDIFTSITPFAVVREHCTQDQVTLLALLKLFSNIRQADDICLKTGGEGGGERES